MTSELPETIREEVDPQVEGLNIELVNDVINAYLERGKPNVAPANPFVHNPNYDDDEAER